MIEEEVINQYMESKVCTRCKVDKSFTEYHKHPDRKDGLQSWCKNCQKERNNEHVDYYTRKMQERWASESPGVYKIFDEVTGEVLYVGESIRPMRRYGEHLYTRKDIKKAYDHSIIGGMISEGKIDRTNLKFEIIEYIDDNDKRKDREVYWINELNPTYNTRGKS